MAEYNNGNITLGERTLPVPSSISDQAQAVIKNAQVRLRAYPDIDDAAGWHARIAESNAGMELMITASVDRLTASGDEREIFDAIETTDINGVTVYVARPPSMSAERETYAYLMIHGGALIYGAGRYAQFMAYSGALEANCTCYSVDYRIPPEHPYPAALDDTLAVYQSLLEQYGADNIIIAGTSAGGNLAAALALKVRDIGLTMPAAVVLQTPEIDLTESGDSFETNRHVDFVLQDSLMPVNLLYANGHDLSDPYLSPLFGDFSKGFPATYLQAGTRDLFLSNAARMHRALLIADIYAELHIGEAQPHGQFSGGTPEDIQQKLLLSKFINRFFKARS